jgi:MFS transporter, DHA2 family, multidrug resistance protein
VLSHVTTLTRTWIGFVAMCVGMFMAILDIQVVASSLTNMQTALGIPSDRLSWIQTTYLIAEVIAIPLTGWLTRALSLRWMFVAATVGFTLASIGCALCSTLAPFIALRAIQGFCGGMLIPAVFTSAFTLLPQKDRVLATVVAGMCAMIAPTIGPAVGGYLTVTYSWHWIFLVNVIPGIAVSLVVARCVGGERPIWSELRRIDYATVLFAGLFLGSLELLLKEAPERDWQGPLVMILGAVCLTSAALGVRRCLRSTHPFVDLRRFRDLSFSLGCALSFVFGMGIYGSVYMMAIFLGAVRQHSPLEIGEIMMVCGAAQILAAPLAAVLETRVDPRFLTAIGFGVFGLGLVANGFATTATDFNALFWPQVLRGLSVMLCLLPATRLALDALPPSEIAEASGLFNLMRNLGGAIGIALIDTILERRTAGHLKHLLDRLQAGDPNAARAVGLPVALFHNVPMGPVDEITKAMVAPLVTRAALTQSFNEAWQVIAALFALSLLALPLMKRAHLSASAMGPGVNAELATHEISQRSASDPSVHLENKHRGSVP